MNTYPPLRYMVGTIASSSLLLSSSLDQYSLFNNHSAPPKNFTACSPIVKGYHKVIWIEKVLGECVRTPSEQASFYIGIISLAFWFISYIPQVMENYRRKQSGLTFNMLVQWFLGDLFNLLGVIVIGSLVTQTIAGIYYVAMDSLMMSQYLYYHVWGRRRRLYGALLADKDKNKNNNNIKELLTPERVYHDGDGNDDDGGTMEVVVDAEIPSSSSTTSLLAMDHRSNSPDYASTHVDELNGQNNKSSGGMMVYSEVEDGIERGTSSGSWKSKIRLFSALYLAVFVGAGLLVMLLAERGETRVMNGSVTQLVARRSMGRHLLAIMDEQRDEDAWNYEFPPKSPLSIFGYIVGCLASLFYFSSRIPQFWTNMKRRSCEGLAPLLFYSAFMGNLTYAVSILLYSQYYNYLMVQLPWIVGAFLVFTMDLSILFQFVLYSWLLKTDKSTGTDAITKSESTSDGSS